MKIEQRPWYPDYIRSTDDDRFILIHFLRDYIFQHRLRYMIYFRISKASKNRVKKLFLSINFIDCAENMELK